VPLTEEEGINSGEGGATIVLLYMSFRNPRVKEPIGNLGSLMPGIQRDLALRELTKLVS